MSWGGWRGRRGFRRLCSIPSALAEIHRHGDGLPRRLDRVADLALLIAYARGLDRADARTVLAAAREATFDAARGLNPPGRPSWARRLPRTSLAGSGKSGTRPPRDLGLRKIPLPKARDESPGGATKKAARKKKPATKDPEGGADPRPDARRSNRSDGAKLKPGVKKATEGHDPRGDEAERLVPPPPLRHPPRSPWSTTHGKPTRLALQAHAWGEPVPQDHRGGPGSWLRRGPSSSNATARGSQSPKKKASAAKKSASRKED